jgi:hypothetical protein
MKRSLQTLVFYILSLALAVCLVPASPVSANAKGGTSITVAQPQNQSLTGSLTEDLFGTLTNNGTSSAAGGFIDTYVNNQNAIRDSFRSTASRYQHAFEISGKDKAFFRMIKAEDAASAANLRGAGAQLTGKLYGGYCIYSDVSQYNDKSKHKHSSLALLDQSMRGFSIIAGSLDYVGVKTAKPLAIGGGIIKDVVGGSVFSNWANQQDNFILYGLDTTTDAINDWTFNAFVYYIDLFNGTDNANVYGRPAYGVGVYKPNIYLYPDVESRITVSFDLPSLLTATVPAYGQPWQVLASPDGSLTDITDGATYDFLFYESLTDPALFTYDSGWLVGADTREEQFRDILAAYGFNENESSDFVNFWTKKLTPGVDYIIYPQLTATIDRAMPIAVQPKPVNNFRLWFAFVPSHGQTVTEPAVAVMDRDGYTLVEWGGFILPK